MIQAIIDLCYLDAEMHMVLAQTVVAGNKHDVCNMYERYTYTWMCRLVRNGS